MNLSGKKLAVIGAGYLQLPLVMRARALGVFTVVFAWEDGAVCREFADRFYPISIIDKEAILAVCRREKIDGIATIASDIAVPTVNFVAQALGLTGNSMESGHLSTHKYAMRQALAAAGIRVPLFERIRNHEEAREAARKTGYPVIVKPCDRSGSMGVCKVERESRLADAVQTALDAAFSHEAILEQWVDIASEISVESISYRGVPHILAVTDKVTTGAPQYVELGQHQPSRQPPEILAEAVRMTEAALRVLKIEYGAAHTELMIDRNGDLFMTETGARMGGDFIGSDLVPLSTGYDFLQGVMEIAFGTFSGVSSGLSHCAGVWFYAQETLQVKSVIEHTPAYPWIVRSELHEAELKPLTRSADRAGYFIYAGDQRRHSDGSPDTAVRPDGR